MTLKNWMAATVLVTGATGFFGGWLVPDLHARGARVVGDRPHSKVESQFYLEGYDELVQVESGNVYDAAFMRGVIHRTRPDYFPHAAYGADVNRVVSQPLECFQSSVESTWVALEAIREGDHPCVERGLFLGQSLWLATLTVQRRACRYARCIRMRCARPRSTLQRRATARSAGMPNRGDPLRELFRAV